MVWQGNILWSKMNHNTVKCFQWWSLVDWWQPNDVLTKCWVCQKTREFLTCLGIWYSNCINTYFNSLAYKLIRQHLRLFNHFFFLPRLGNLSCAQSGKVSPCPVCTLWMWFSMDSHLALMVSLSPLGVEATLQYKWLMMLLCHSLITPQSFSLPAASSFLRNPAHHWHEYNNYYDDYDRDTFLPFATCQTSS